jgi:hypothetical protein
LRLILWEEITVAIEIHCVRCGKTIRAPDNAGGKRGRCPGCGHEMYIPVPPDQIEEIPLAPVDEEEERKAAELRREAIRYAAMVDKSGGAPTDARKGGGRSGRGGQGSSASIDVAKEVADFVLAMGNSQFEDAEAVVARLRGAGKKAREYVQSLLVDQMPPKFGKVQPQIAKNFLKALSDRLEG